MFDVVTIVTFIYLCSVFARMNIALILLLTSPIVQSVSVQGEAPRAADSREATQSQLGPHPRESHKGNTNHGSSSSIAVSQFQMVYKPK